MPKGQDLETLLPRKVGTFTREAFPAGTKPSDSEDINIDYKSGAEVINVGFSIPGNEGRARGHSHREGRNDRRAEAPAPREGNRDRAGT